MSGTIALSNIVLDFRKKDGSLNAGGTLEFFENLTLTPKAVFDGYGSSTQLANPLQFDAGGFEPGAWMSSGVYRIRLRETAPTFPSVLGPVVWTKDNINISTSSSVAQTGNAIVNGSFEDGTDGTTAGAPINWTLTTYTGSTFLVDPVDASHGAFSVKCTSTGNGGATLVTNSFSAVGNNEVVVWKLRTKSTVADVRNIVSIAWYTLAKVLISTTSIIDNSTTNPTAWTVLTGTTTAPSNAAFYKVTLVGCSPSDPTQGSTWFDGVEFGSLPRQETNNIWSGNQTILGEQTISNIVPKFTLIETDVSADNKRWDIIASGEDMHVRVVNDADNAVSTAIYIRRTGVVIDEVRLDKPTATADPTIALGLATKQYVDVPRTQAQIANTAIGQAQLKTTAGSVSTTTGQALLTLPGGQYGFYPYLKGFTSAVNGTATIGSAVNAVTAAAVEVLSIPITDTTLIAIGTSLAAQPISATQRYIQASPPYNLGDGDIQLFIFAEIDTLGNIISAYSAPEAPWHYNGPTTIKPDFYKDGVGYQMKSEFLLEHGSIKNAISKGIKIDKAMDDIAVSKIVQVEVTQSIKNADMGIMPHPFLSKSAGNTVIMIDPVSTMCEKLCVLQECGESVLDLLHDGYIVIGDKVKRFAPTGVDPISVKWKLTK